MLQEKIFEFKNIDLENMFYATINIGQQFIITHTHLKNHILKYLENCSLVFNLLKMLNSIVTDNFQKNVDAIFSTQDAKILAKNIRININKYRSKRLILDKIYQIF